MTGQLFCVSGTHAGEIFPLSTTPIIIGRNPNGSNIILPNSDLEFSGKHAAVWYDPNQNVCLVQDFSTNGIFREYSGERLPKEQTVMVRPGERFFLVNRNCMFEFQLTQDAGSDHHKIIIPPLVYNDAIYAGFWLRLGATVIDFFITSIAASIVSVILISIMGAYIGIAGPRLGNDFFGLLLGYGIVLDLVLIVSYWLYFALMESSVHQGTLGKLAVGIKVTDLYGNRTGFWRATGRYFGKIISGAILSIGFIMVAFTDRKQGLHDIMAKCLVVKK